MKRLVLAALLGVLPLSASAADQILQFCRMPYAEQITLRIPKLEFDYTYWERRLKKTDSGKFEQGRHGALKFHGTPLAKLGPGDLRKDFRSIAFKVRRPYSGITEEVVFTSKSCEYPVR